MKQMKQLMNVVVFLSRGVSAGRNPAPMEDGRENYTAAFWKHIVGIEGPIEQSTAEVSFERRRNGGEFCLRVVRIEDIKPGLDPRFPTLVLCAAGKQHWLSKEVTGDVAQLGKPEGRYGSVVILSPGEVATGATYRRSPRQAQVLGAWQVPGPLGSLSLFFVTTSADADLGQPVFEPVETLKDGDNLDLDDGFDGGESVEDEFPSDADREDERINYSS